MRRNKISFIIVMVVAFISIAVNFLPTNVKATEYYSNAADVATQCFKGYNSGEKGPISIVKGDLTANSVTKSVYFIFLSGTEIVNSQATGWKEDLLVFFEQDNDYLKDVLLVIKENIPTGSNLVIAGHSLGGMIAQQLSGNSAIKNNYNVLNVVTFGSPLINPVGREGIIKRLGDTSDLVPYLSASGTILLAWQVLGLNTEDGGYGTDVLSAHLKSYLREDVWGCYDVTGVKNGNATFSFSSSNITFYKAPSL